MRTATWGEYIQQVNGGTVDATKAIHHESLYAVVNVATNTTEVVAVPALLFGAYVNTGLSAHTILFQDRTTASMSVSAATSANPIDITTAVAHGLVSDQTATFLTMGGDFGTNLNGNSYVITYVSATRFTINVNGAAYASYGGGGTVIGATTVAIIPASAAAGAMYTFPGFRFETTLVMNPNDAATGNITIAYRPL